MVAIEDPSTLSPRDEISYVPPGETKPRPYPAFVSVVQGQENGCVLVYPKYGGFRKRTPFSDVTAYFRLVLDEDKTFTYRKATFCLEGTDIFYEGHSDGRNWNGIPRPLFTKETMEQAFEMAGEGEELWWQYVSETDAFRVYEPDLEPCLLEGFDIEVDGETIHVYDMGELFWVWGEVSEEEKREAGLDL